MKLSKFYFFIFINYYNKSVKIFKNVFLSFEMTFLLKWWTEKGIEKFVCHWIIIIRINYYNKSFKIFKNVFLSFKVVFLWKGGTKFFILAFFKNFKIFLLRANKERNSETFDAVFNSVSNLPTIQFELLKNWKISNVFFLRSKEKKE